MDFAFVHESLAATSLLEPAEVCRTELKPFLTIFGTRMRATTSFSLSSSTGAGLNLVVVSSPLIWLAKIGRLPLLKILFGQVVIPRRVCET